MKHLFIRKGRGFLSLAFLLSLSACGTLIPKTAPSCDGFTRRPLNPSLWDVRTTFGALTESSDVRTSFNVSRPLSGAAIRRVTRSETGIAFLEIPQSGVLEVRTSYDRCGLPS